MFVTYSKVKWREQAKPWLEQWVSGASHANSRRNEKRGILQQTYTR